MNKTCRRLELQEHTPSIRYYHANHHLQQKFTEFGPHPRYVVKCGPLHLLRRLLQWSGLKKNTVSSALFQAQWLNKFEFDKNVRQELTFKLGPTYPYIVSNQPPVCQMLFVKWPIADTTRCHKNGWNIKSTECSPALINHCRIGHPDYRLHRLPYAVPQMKTGDHHTIQTYQNGATTAQNPTSTKRCWRREKRD